MLGCHINHNEDEAKQKLIKMWNQNYMLLCVCWLSLFRHFLMLYMRLGLFQNLAISTGSSNTACKFVYKSNDNSKLNRHWSKTPAFTHVMLMSVCYLLTDWKWCLTSGWSVVRAVCHQSSLSSKQSVIRVVCLQGGLSSEWMSSGWYVIKVVCHQGGLSSKQSVVKVVCHQSSLSSGWSVIRVVCQGGLSSK